MVSDMDMAYKFQYVTRLVNVTLYVVVRMKQ